MKIFRTMRPENLHIITREMKFSFEGTMTKGKFWNQRGAIVTHFINAFQETFPEGEKLFIEAALDCNKKYAEKNPAAPQLLEDFGKFSRQEARHGLIHQLWTKELIRAGYEGMVDFDKDSLDFRIKFRKHHSPEYRLAYTAAAEHYTASMAHMFVDVSPDVLSKSKMPYSAVLLYHSMEELEHKSVCYDLYQFYSGNYLIRFLSFWHLTYNLYRKVYARLKYLLKEDGIWDKQHRKEAFQFFFGKQGLVSGMSKRINSYLKPSFHPWQTDDRAKVNEKFMNLRMEAEIQDFQY